MAKIYFVIASYYGGQRLERILNHIRSLPLEDFTILTNEQCGEKRPVLGVPLLYNALHKAALHDPNCQYIWQLGDDIEPLPNCIVQCQEEIEKDNTIGVLFPLEAWTEKGVVSGLDHTNNTFKPIEELITSGQSHVEYHFPWLTCTVMRRDTLESVGPLDESIGRGYCEDLDWGIRCWQAGWRVVLYRRTYYLHARGATYDQLQKEGKFGSQEPYEAADRVKKKWPFLWRETNEWIIKHCREMREECLKSS